MSSGTVGLTKVSHFATLRSVKSLSKIAFLASTSLIALLSVANAQTTIIDKKAMGGVIEIEATGERGDGPVEGYVAKQSTAGSKTDTPIEKTPQSISVIPKQQMEDQAVESVSEAARYSAGVFAEYRGSSNFHDELFIRGFYYAPRYFDGLVYGTNSHGQIDPYFLERVEIVRGPTSVLYGQITPGGLLNLTGKKPTGETGGEVEVGTGTGNKLETNFDLFGAISDSLSYRVVGTAERMDMQEDFVEQERFGIAPSLTWTPSDDTVLTLSGFYLEDPKLGSRNFAEARGLVYPTAFGNIPRSFFVSDPSFEEANRAQFSIGYDLEHDINDTFSVRQKARYNFIEQRHKTLTWGSIDTGDERMISRRASGGSDDLHQFLVDNQGIANFTTGDVKHTLLGGLDYKYSYRDYQWGFGSVADIDWTDPTYGGYENLVLTPRSDSETTATQYGLYAQDQVEVGDLTVTFGGRYDWADTEIANLLNGTEENYSDRAFTGRVGATYSLPYGFAPYASYSTSFEPVTRSASAGDPAFEPTTGEQFEIGLKYVPKDAPIQITASLYDLTQQNVLFYDSTTSSFYQTGEIHNQGVELEGHAQVTPNLNLVGSYSYIDSEVTKSIDASVVGKMPARIPGHQASLWGKYDFLDGALKGLGLGLGVRYTGESKGDGSNSFTVDSYTLFDASVSYDLGGVADQLSGTAVQVNATNLTDDRYVASCASAYACWYGDGRQISASLKYKW